MQDLLLEFTACVLSKPENGVQRIWPRIGESSGRVPLHGNGRSDTNRIMTIHHPARVRVHVASICLSLSLLTFAAMKHHRFLFKIKK